MITTPALEIPDAYRVAAIAVGAGLMLVIAAARLIERARIGPFLVALAAWRSWPVRCGSRRRCCWRWETTIC